MLDTLAQGAAQDAEPERGRHDEVLRAGAIDLVGTAEVLTILELTLPLKRT